MLLLRFFQKGGPVFVLSCLNFVLFILFLPFFGENIDIFGNI